MSISLPVHRRRSRATSLPAPCAETPVRIILASPAGLVLLGLRQVIASIDNTKIVATATSAPALARTLRQHPADVLILDQDLAEAASSTLLEHPTRTLLLSPRTHSGRSTIPASACGFISERSPLEQARNALKIALSCRGRACPVTSSRRSAACSDCPLPDSLRAVQPLPLSQRELEVFALIGRGLATRTIASQLHRSIKTIETHRENIKRKLGLDNASELVDAARRWTKGDVIAHH